MRAKACLLLSVLTFAACGGDDGSGAPNAPDARVVPECTLTATIESDGATVTSRGYVTCDRPAAILLQVCVQGTFPNNFQDVECQGDAQMAITTLEVSSIINCDDTSATSFRTNAFGMVDGQQLPEMKSATITCP